MLSRHCVILLAFPLVASSVVAELPVATLTTIFPPGCSIGGSVEVSLAGANLQGVQSLCFTDPRITAKLQTPPATRPTDPVRFSVSVAGDVPPRVCDVWAVGKYGVSNPRAFDLHAGTQATLPAGHTTAATAFDQPIGLTTFAAAEPKTEHCFRLNLNANRRVEIEVSSSGLDSKMEPRFVLIDPTGREVSWSEDGREREFTPPADGAYILRVSDLLYRGGLDYAFKVLVTLDSQPATQPVDLPPTAAFLDETALRAAVPEISSEPLKPPCIVRGVFRAPRFAANYRFDAPANAVYWIEVTSDRLGSTAAPMLVIQRVEKDAAGHEKASDVAEVKPTPINTGLPAFSTATRDPVYRLECKQAGTYRVLVHDLFGPGQGPAEYVLAIRNPTPDFRVVALPAEPPPEPKDSVDVPLTGTIARRCGVAGIDVVALRRDGFEGPIALSVTGLPRGLTAGRALIPAGITSTRVLLMATDDAPAWAGPIHIEASATVDGKELRRPAKAGTVSFTRYDAATKTVVVNSRVTESLQLAVSGDQIAPLAIKPATRPVTEVVAGAKAVVPLQFIRHEAFAGSISVSLRGHPATAAMPPIPVDIKTNSVELVIDTAVVKLPPGEFVLYAAAEGTFKHTDNVDPVPHDVSATFYSEPFTLNVMPPTPATGPAKK